MFGSHKPETTARDREQHQVEAAMAGRRTPLEHRTLRPVERLRNPAVLRHIQQVLHILHSKRNMSVSLSNGGDCQI